MAFASIALGVGIDYAVHVLCPLDLKGRFDIRFAAGVAGKLAAPILVICSTTLMAFVIVGCLGGGMVQLGAFGLWVFLRLPCFLYARYRLLRFRQAEEA